MQRKRKLIGAVLALVVTAVVAGGASGAGTAQTAGARPPAPRPNIVFVLTDDLSRNLVAYMPHVKAMRRHGTTFSNYFVTDSLCCPSRSTIFTGRFPHNTKVFGNMPPDGGFQVFHARGEESDTFATSLQRAGYRTAMMGKYLNGYQARSAPGSPTGYVPPGWNEWDVTDNGYGEYGYDLNVNGHIEPHGHAPRDYLTNVVAGKGVSFIDREARARRPFMLEIATFAPHGPYTPAPRDVGRFARARAPRGPAFNRQNVNPPAWLGHRSRLTPRQIRRIDRGYRLRAEAVQAVDRMIGRLEAALRRNGVARNTYLVFSSDNGYHMGQRRLMPGKQTAFDHDIRVPLVVVGPHVRRGRTVPQIVQNTDLRETFSRIGGAGVPGSVDGRSVLRLLRRPGAPRNWRSAALIEHHGPADDPNDPDHASGNAGDPTTYEALRTRRALYVEYSTGEREYYGLGKDPWELVNRYPRLPDRARTRLHRRLVALERCSGMASCRRAGRTAG